MLPSIRHYLVLQLARVTYYVSVAQAEEKARKAFEKVKAKYDSALKDLQEAQAELDSKIQDRARLIEQRRLAELKIQEQVKAKQSHDVSGDLRQGVAPAAVPCRGDCLVERFQLTL